MNTAQQLRALRANAIAIKFSAPRAALRKPATKFVPAMSYDVFARRMAAPNDVSWHIKLPPTRKQSKASSTKARTLRTSAYGIYAGHFGNNALNK